MSSKRGRSGRIFKFFAVAMAVCAAAAVFLVGLSSPLEAKELEKVTVRFSWFKASGPHAIYYLTEDRGYYAEEGLKLDALGGKGSPRTVKLVGAADAGIFGHAGYESMAPAINQGVPVKGIFGLYQMSPQAVISHADKPIKTAKDLIGKKFAVSPQSNQETMFYAVLEVQNISRDQLTIVHAPFDMANTLFLQGKVDGLLHFYTTILPLLGSKGAKLHYLKYADMGVNVPSNGVITNLKTIKEKPELIRRFLRATAKGLRDAREDPGAAVAAMAKYVPRARGKEKILTENLKLSLELFSTPETKDKPIGWIYDKHWEKALDVLMMVKWIDKKLSHEKYYTNEFNPGINWKQ